MGTYAADSMGDTRGGTKKYRANFGAEAKLEMNFPRFVLVFFFLIQNGRLRSVKNQVLSQLSSQPAVCGSTKVSRFFMNKFDLW